MNHTVQENQPINILIVIYIYETEIIIAFTAINISRKNMQYHTKGIIVHGHRDSILQGKQNTAMLLYCFYYSGDFNKGTCSRSVIF
ncbi:Uncharacterised protein [Escherichia coli]|nr:Uncharacterised protein [Escherichia coli]CAD5671078.1 Uncharacterised protein [Escherichia coli]